MLKSILILLTFLIFICGCSTVKNAAITPTVSKNIFQNELENIYEQQYSIRRSQWLKNLQNESRRANTLSNINKLELMLENPDIDSMIKNNNLIQHFDRAMLYMQIMFFPERRETFLQKKIRNELSFELSSIFLNCTLAAETLSKLPENPVINNHWQNLISNQKIEYDTLRINEFNAAEKMPDISYPLHTVPLFKNLDHYRSYKYTSARSAAQSIYPKLKDGYDGKLPLVLLKLIYKSPYELNNLYANDIQLKKDFCNLLTELVWLWQSEEYFNNMSNAFVISQDFQKSAASNNTPEMLDGCAKSRLAYELAHLKMLANISASPFIMPEPPQDNIAQLPSSRTETLNLILNELLEKI